MSPHVPAPRGLLSGTVLAALRAAPGALPLHDVTALDLSGIADPLAARNLLELYLRARFGRREPTAADVAAARAAVARLRATWPDPVAAGSLDVP